MKRLYLHRIRTGGRGWPFAFSDHPFYLMIVRRANSSDKLLPLDCVVAISQPTHSWISGEIGKSWGNDKFDLVNPLPEFLLGVALHDIGFCDCERRPKINPATKLPYSFIDIPHAEHLMLWDKGYEILRHISGFAALFQSLHASHLYKKYGTGRTAEDHEITQDFLRYSSARQSDLLEHLRNDLGYGFILDPEAVSYFQDLVAAWDGLSLELCGGLEKPAIVSEVPINARKKISLNLHPLNHEKIQVDPWPFHDNRITMSWDYRILRSEYSNQTEFDEAWPNSLIGRKRLELLPS